MEINYTLDMEYGQFRELLSFGEAAELWKLDQSTLRKAVQDGRLIPGHDCRKFGKQWVVTVEAMARVFQHSAGSHDYTKWSQFKCNLQKTEAQG